MPKEVTKIISKYCKDSLKKCSRVEDRARIKRLSKDVNEKWRELSNLMCLKPEAIQRVISVQLIHYRQEMKTTCKESTNCKREQAISETETHNQYCARER